ncbi:hypothetical protein [Saccharomonospora sp. CUA-673]|uniref:hypothetical protein n=1 Tax=Saccharomonospora sp. CUA-673 TaxID=1904969 RepID=UPI001C9E2C0C|nr:hypothetical protein [Saccharomonospora sp. CUA-673]
MADKAAEHLTTATWRRLVRENDRRHCKQLAKLADALLAGRKYAHDIVGNTAGFAATMFGGPRIVQSAAREIARSIPLPWDETMIATARRLQLTGVALCVVAERELTTCHCFVQLAKSETRERVAAILTTSVQDWTHLAAYPDAPAWR